MTIFQIPDAAQMIRSDLPAFVKSKNLLPEIDNLFHKACKPENISDRDRSNVDFAARVWLYASLVDAAQNDRDYPAEKNDCKKEWENAVRFLKFELNKRRLFSSVLINDVNGLCERGAASLKVLGTDAGGAALSNWVRTNGESLSDLYDSLITLEKRLLDAAEKAKPWQS